MARLGSQAKMGFFPASPIAIDGIISHLALPPKGSESIQIIDPCCGEGAAINQIARGLGVPQNQVYAVELDAARAAKARELMPNAHVAGPASFMGMSITGYSFGLAYVNPPFDSELGGGGREEQRFVETATRLLVPGGTLVLVCPLGALNRNSAFCEYLDSRYDNLRMFAFPTKVRHYEEIVVIATKRKEILGDETLRRLGTLHQMQFEYKTYPKWLDMLSRVNEENYNTIMLGVKREAIPKRIYHLAKGWKPHNFVKSEYLPEELEIALDRSPLNGLLDDVKPHVPGRPPLPPGKGHVALLLASGGLDGVVETGTNNHVVRGTAKKIEYYNEAASTVNEDSKGNTKTVDVYSQRIVLVIRAAWQDGTILTLSDEPEQLDKPGNKGPDENEEMEQDDEG